MVGLFVLLFTLHLATVSGFPALLSHRYRTEVFGDHKSMLKA